MSQALYRKYRSRSLDEVLGQDHVTSILRRALEQGKIAHAYLLTGPRGVGKHRWREFWRTRLTICHMMTTPQTWTSLKLTQPVITALTTFEP